MPKASKHSMRIYYCARNKKKQYFPILRACVLSGHRIPFIMYYFHQIWYQMLRKMFVEKQKIYMCQPIFIHIQFNLHIIKKNAHIFPSYMFRRQALMLPFCYPIHFPPLSLNLVFQLESYVIVIFVRYVKCTDWIL